MSFKGDQFRGETHATVCACMGEGGARLQRPQLSVGAKPNSRRPGRQTQRYRDRYIHRERIEKLGKHTGDSWQRENGRFREAPKIGWLDGMRRPTFWHAMPNDAKRV